MSRPPPPARADFRWFMPITTRWMDNDPFGHVNNVVYYSWIDTAVNRFLIEGGALDIAASPVVGIVAETGCRYISQIAYPDPVTVGIAAVALGRSSVRYEAGIFRAAADAASAVGHFTHVYCDRAAMRPVPIPGPIRSVIATIQRPAPQQGG
jgi:acyl-CoA thioester hydrolase